jgi:hypothetical protein
MEKNGCFVSSPLVLSTLLQWKKGTRMPKQHNKIYVFLVSHLICLLMTFASVLRLALQLRMVEECHSGLEVTTFSFIF